MRVVLDTNVIVAAFAAHGLCSEIFETAVSGHSIVISEFILNETREKLIRKIKLPEKTVSDIVDYLKDIAEIVTPVMLDASICRDKKDIKIIGTAVAGSADFIVTGDDDLLVLKTYKRIKIITPRQLWNTLKGQ